MKSSSSSESLSLRNSGPLLVKPPARKNIHFMLILFLHTVLKEMVRKIISSYLSEILKQCVKIDFVNSLRRKIDDNLSIKNVE